MEQKGKQTEFYEPSPDMMTPKERESYLNEKIEWVVQYAYDNAPGVKNKLDKAGIDPSQIRTFNDLQRIPITRKDELVELQKANMPLGGLVAVPINSLKRIHVSPGPIYEPQERGLDTHHTADWLYAAGFRKGDLVINTFTYHLVGAGHWADEGLEAIGAVVIPTGVGNTELQVQIMRDLKVTGYFGTPSFLMTIIKKAEEMGYDFKSRFTLKNALFIAEMLPPSLRKSFEQDYGINTSQAYGTSDVGLITGECSQKQGMHITKEAAVEIADPITGKQLGPGEVGEVVVTRFNNTYPLIRFGTGDLSSYTEELCSCGRTSSRLVGILGRTGDAVKVRGMFIHPKQIGEVISKFSKISKCQVIISRTGVRDEMTFMIEMEDEAADKGKVSQQLQESIKDICRLKADKIEFVTKGTIPEEFKSVVDKRTWE